MIRRTGLAIILIIIFQNVFGQVQSPEQFLGYPLGSRYTPHHRVVEYFRQVANAMPTMVKLQDYGKTNEGRDLIVSFISSPSNISNLEAIRSNNLGLARMANAGTVNNAPVIVWLSYNVHGNETSSSEAAMMTIYELVNPANSKSKQWIQNTVVVIDPCINPDGRDRYINWFQSVVGKKSNPSLNAREHHEPWPGGRVNHYYFDLNRDWAWQTQLESQQRMILYQKWMPQVHVDFHEQGVNNPYYFAPAAQPYHEVITPWQRQFQQTIGRNHAKYFDEKGWLYFTREVFDLLYPSYGDTYPIFNGAIGMTYEQAGGPRGGLATVIEDGDTLTLRDRILHHYTTGMSTVETASASAASLLSEFQKYFSDAVTKGMGDYKSYVIRYSAKDEQRVQNLKELLQKNGISYTKGKTGNYKGYNYENGKEESFSLTANDLLIPGLQPKAALVKVLFEPNTMVVDSNTYDITAWALPYAYGLKAWAVKASIAAVGDAATSSATAPAIPDDAYAVVIPWSGVNSVKLVGRMLQRGFRLRINEQPFESGGQSFERGSILVLRNSNGHINRLWQEVRSMAGEAGVNPVVVKSGFVDKGYDFGSSKVHPLKNRRVALATGDGISPNAVGEIWHYFEQVIDYPITLVDISDGESVRWNDFDVVILPNGSYPFLSEKGSADAFRSWISSGGHVVALEGAVAQLSRLEGLIKLRKPADPFNLDPYASLKKYEDRERDFIPNLTPGSIYRVELDNTHPLGFGYPPYYYTLKQDDNIYEFISDGGWNVGIIRKDRQVAGFVGSKLQNRLQDGLLFGVQDIGGGTITYLADDVIFRSFWENGKLMLANAVFLVGQ